MNMMNPSAAKVDAPPPMPPHHAGMDHSAMNHAGMDHSAMNHGAHAGHDMSGHGSMQMIQAPDGDTMMVMGGMPPWMFIAAVIILIVGSFAIVEWLGVRATPLSRFRWNLIRNRKIYLLVKSRWFQAIPQFAMLLVFAGLIGAGLFGNRVNNVTPIAVWTVWWATLIFFVALLGPLFCFMCPWDAISNLVTRFRIRKVVPLGLDLKPPAILRTMYPAIWLFVGLTWAELGLGVTTDPRATAYMGLGMAVVAVSCALVFEKKTFCASLCPVGRISGLYANFSPFEIRARNPRACESCETEDCLKGNDRGYPCPTGISLKIVDRATSCTWCTECVKTCPRFNVALNLRSFGQDLVPKSAIRSDEAWLAVSLLALTLFHGFSMTTVWENFIPGEPSVLEFLTGQLGLSHWLAFTVAMAVSCALPIGLYAASCWGAQRLAGVATIDYQTLFRGYSWSLLPVALFYHLAHNSMHILMEGLSIIPALSDPLGRGHDYLGTANMSFGHIASDTVTWYLQIILIAIGHLVGIVVAHRTSRRLFSDPRAATRSLLPLLIVMVIISACGLSLMVADMNMRVGRM